MKAWELDPIVLSVSKDFFGLQDLVDRGVLVSDPHQNLADLISYWRLSF